MEAKLNEAFQLVSLPNNQAIKEGEKQLEQLRKYNIDYPIALLHYINNQNVQDIAKLRAAIELKLWCQIYNTSDEFERQQYASIIESIKESIIFAYLQFPLKISKTLRPGIISLADVLFPNDWQNLMTSLLGYAKQNPTSIVAILKLIQNITHKYTYSQRSDPLYEQIIKVCDQVHDFLKDLTFGMIEQVRRDQSNTGQIEVLELLMKLFYNLNYQDLHPKYEDNLQNWMQALKQIMKLQNTSEQIFKCKGAVLEVILLYANKYKEDVQDTIKGFCQQIWILCSGASEDPEYDPLVLNCLKFFKSLMNWSEMQPFFMEHINSLFENLIIPNIAVNSTAKALFQQQPEVFIDYYFRNTEINTRRSAAIQLLRVICRSYNVYPRYLQNQLQNFIQQPADIKAQCIIIGLTIDGCSKGFRDVDGCTQLYVDQKIIQFCYQNIAKKSLGQFYEWIISNPNKDILQRFNEMHVVIIIRYLFYFRIFIPREQLPSIVQFLTSIKTKHLSLRKVIYLSINGFLIMKHGDFDYYRNLVPFFNPEITKTVAVDVLRVIYEGTTAEQFLNESLTKMFWNVTRALKEINCQFYEYQIEIIKQMIKRTEHFDFSSVQFLFETIGILSYYYLKTNSQHKNDLEKVVLDFFGIALKTKSDLLNFCLQVLAIYLLLESQTNNQYIQIYNALMLPQNWKEENQSVMSSYIQFITAYITKYRQHLVSCKEKIEIILSKIIQIDHFELFYRFIEAIMFNITLQQFSKSGYMKLFVQGAQALAGTIHGKKSTLLFTCKLIVYYGLDTLHLIDQQCYQFFAQLLSASMDIVQSISIRTQRRYIFVAICMALSNNYFGSNTQIEGEILNSLIANTVDRFKMKNFSSAFQEREVKQKKESTYRKLQVFKQFEKQESELQIDQQQVLVRTFKQVVSCNERLLSVVSNQNRDRIMRLSEKFNK